MEIEPGMTYTSECMVNNENSAANWGSGSLDVFATPAMVALMENAAVNAVAPALAEGSDTVGTAVNIVHTKATPMGDTVRATATLTAVDGRRLTFEVTASDSDGEIGSGTHERFVIDAERFMARLKK